MEDKTVSILRTIAAVIILVFLSWLLRGVIGLLTALLLFVLSIFPAFIDLFIGIITLGDDAGAWSAYIDWITSMDLSNVWIFWDVLIFAPFLFFYISGCIESGSLSFGSPKSQLENTKFTRSLNKNNTPKKREHFSVLESRVEEIKERYRSDLHFRKDDANKQIRKAIQKWCNKNGSFTRIEKLYSQMKLK